MAKINQNSIVQPTEQELEIYKTLLGQIDEPTLDVLTNEYFDLVAQEKINVSFPKFLMDKFIRPIKPGDSIQFTTEEKEQVYLFCLVRKTIENVDYLVFAKIEPQTETLYHDEVYLFYVCGKDEDGMEIIDILPNCEETERILNILEDIQDDSVTQVDTENIREEEFKD